MLDLSVFREQYFELKLFDGEVLKLKKPTQRMVIEMMGYEQIFKNTKNHTNIEMMVDTFSQMILDILNNNANERVFTKQFVEENFDLFCCVGSSTDILLSCRVFALSHQAVTLFIVAVEENAPEQINRRTKNCQDKNEISPFSFISFHLNTHRFCTR